MAKTSQKINYIPEIVLNSELQLRNNSMLLEQDKSLFNVTYFSELMILRDEYTALDYSDEEGLQETKKEIRDRIRIISSKTFVDRDKNIFGSMLLLVCNKLATSSRFSGYDFLTDMKSLAIEHVLKYSHKYDPFRQSLITDQYSSSFAYITTICFNAFVQVINTNKKEQEKIKADFLETQKMFHSEPNRDNTLKEHSEIDDEIHINKINEGLYNTIIKLNLERNTDIKIIYPNDYHISIEEYQEITKFSRDNDICLSIVRYVEPVESIEEGA